MHGILTKPIFRIFKTVQVSRSEEQIIKIWLSRTNLLNNPSSAVSNQAYNADNYTVVGLNDIQLSLKPN